MRLSHFLYSNIPPLVSLYSQVIVLLTNVARQNLMAQRTIIDSIVYHRKLHVMQSLFDERTTPAVQKPIP